MESSLRSRRSKTREPFEVGWALEIEEIAVFALVSERAAM